MRNCLIILALSMGLFGADCDIVFTLTNAGDTVQFNNKGKACANFQVSYFSSGFSAVNFQFESAPDAGTTPGAWVAFAGSTLIGSNPMTATTQATSTFSGVYPWIRVRLVSKTGTGQITGRLLGIQLTSAGIGFFNGGIGPQNLTPPVISDFAFSGNLGNSTQVAIGTFSPQGSVNFNGVDASVTGNMYHGRAMPTPPYTVDLVSYPVTVGGGGFPNVGAKICLRDSSSGRVIAFGATNQSGGATNLTVGRFTSLTAFSANALNNGIGQPSTPVSLRIRDTGANNVFSLCSMPPADAADSAGVCLAALTESRTAWLAAPDQIGYCIDDGGASLPIGAILIHWKVWT